MVHLLYFSFVYVNKVTSRSVLLQVVEEALKKTPNNEDLQEELAKAKEELRSAMQEKEEAEAEQKLAEAQQHHAFFVKVSLVTSFVYIRQSRDVLFLESCRSNMRIVRSDWRSARFPSGSTWRRTCCTSSCS